MSDIREQLKRISLDEMGECYLGPEVAKLLGYGSYSSLAGQVTGKWAGQFQHRIHYCYLTPGSSRTYAERMRQRRTKEPGHDNAAGLAFPRRPALALPDPAPVQVSMRAAREMLIVRTGPRPFAEPDHRPGKPWRSRKYRRYVAAHPCASCGTWQRVSAHHHGPADEKAVGRKVGDEWCVPLCDPFCHTAGIHGPRPQLPGRPDLDTKDKIDSYLHAVSVRLLMEWFAGHDDEQADKEDEEEPEEEPEKERPALPPHEPDEEGVPEKPW